MKWSPKKLVPALATLLMTVACAPSTPPDSVGSSTTQATNAESTTTTLGLFDAEVVNPSGSLIATETWGVVPSDLVDVLLVEGSGLAEAEAVASAIGGEVVGSIDLISYFQIRIAGGTETELTSAFELAAAQPSVESAFPELLLFGAEGEASCVAEGPLQNPWFLDPTQPANAKPYQAVGLEQAWAAVRASGIAPNPTKVGVIDTALFTGSSELAGTVHIAGASASDTTDQPAKNAAGQISFGGFNHGTGVAHVIGADPSNGGMVGVASVLESNLDISVSGVLDMTENTAVAPNPRDLTQIDYGEGGAWSSTTLAAIIKQVNRGSTVINLSMGVDNPGSNVAPQAAAVRRLLEKVHQIRPNVVFVAAAGNEAAGLDGSNQFPGGAPLPNLITVGAVDSDGTSASFTNFAVAGGEVTIAAPGVSVPMGTGADGKPFHSNGTSFAAPMVAGAVALLQSLDPSLTAEQIKEILKATANSEVTEGAKTTPIAANLGGGILRVDKATLQVINDVRARGANPKPPLDWDTIEALAGLTAFAAGSGEESQTVTALVGNVSEGGTSLIVTVLSDGSISGNAMQTLSAPGSVTWNVSLNGGFGELSVQRTDSGVGCVLKVEPPEVDGSWVGEMVVTSVEITGDTIELENPDGTTTTMTKEECEALLADNNEPSAIQFTFTTTSPGVGTVNGTTDEGNSPSGSWILIGRTITFEMVSPDQPFPITFEGTVGDRTIQGTWEGTNEDLVLKGTFSLVPAAE